MTQKKYILLLLILVIISSKISAQVKVNGYLTIPKILNDYCKLSVMNDFYENNRILDNEEQDAAIVWLVYSDRENNSCFNGGTENSGVKSKIRFMEKLWVSEMKNNWLHVWDFENNKKVDKGWIHCKKLILSEYSLLNDYSLPKKAMALITANRDNLKDLNNLNASYYKTFSEPSLENEKTTLKKLEIFYILKETPGKKLISSSDKLNGSSTEMMQVYVKGWMSSSQLTNWDSRICLEYSNYGNSVKAYANKFIPTFASEGLLDNFMGLSANEIDPNLKYNGLIKKKRLVSSNLNNYDPRFPLIRNLSSTKKQIATIGSLNENSSNSPSVVIEKLQKSIDNLSNLNILFVIDGTESMQSFMKSIGGSLKAIIENSKNYDRNLKVKFGFSIYRDYGHGRDSFEIESLNSNVNDIANKISQINCIFPNGLDKDKPEAVYMGLINGINKVHFVEEQSNLIILIGDCGNHTPDLHKYELAVIPKLIKKYNAGLISFQVNNGTDLKFGSYQKFNTDVIKLLSSTAKLYNPQRIKLTPEAKDRNTLKLTLEYGNNTNNEDLLFFGRFTFAKDNSMMNLERLSTGIQSFTTEKLIQINKVKAKLEDAKRGGVEQFTLEFLEWLRNNGYSERDIEIMKKIGDFSFEGYTSTKFYEKEEDCYLPVVFLSATEIADLRDVFKGLIDNQIGITQIKINTKQALITMASKAIGSTNKNGDDVRLKTLDDIWQLIIGIQFDKNNKYGNLKNTKLQDITNVKDEVFTEFNNDVRMKVKNFTINNLERYRFKSSGQDFYWVPLTEFPGND